MFRTDLLSIIRSLNTVHTATDICHAGYVDCLLARSGCIMTSLANSQQRYSALFVKFEEAPVNVMNDNPVEVYIHLPQVTDMSDGNRNLYSACALCM